MNMGRLVLLAALLLLPCGLSRAEELKLWYDRPAAEWVEALPLGNSRLGAMVYGIPHREELQLNEETIWAGGPYRNDNPRAHDALPEVRKLVFEGKYREADNLANETFFSSAHGMPYQTAGSVIVSFPGHETYKDYYRDLNLSRALTTTRYTVDGVNYRREVFTSFADDVIIMRVTSSEKGALNFEMEYANPSKHKVFAKDGALVLEGRGTDHEGVPGEIQYRINTVVNNKDGEVVVGDDKISVRNATEAVMYISIGTNFVNYLDVSGNPQVKAEGILNTAMRKSYQKALDEHTRIYGRQFDRFKIDLGSSSKNEGLTTPERIAGFHREQDPSLVALLCQFGRYLLICSSQPGGQPSNLQGIWCDNLYPAWDSKYTININTEMNYWPSEVTNLSETHEPLFQMLRELSNSGRETARVTYGAEGWVAHHNTDLWRVTSPIDFAAAGMWPTGGAWLCQHLWEHFLFTEDKAFLADIYPVMKGSADYFMTSMVEHPEYGWKVVAPSISPEHGPVTAGCTMDNQLVFDMLLKTAMANEILGLDPAYRESLRLEADRLPPMQIGKYSQLQEWLEDIDDPKNEHRHVSHLYGLYPGNQITPNTSPELFEAARNSLIYRGDMATGWSIGWKVNLWARLQDGNHAYKIIKNMLTLADDKDPDGRTYPNMFTAHPPFQIDGNFGLTAGVAEMLIQSHDGAVHLLPALPDVWPSGEVHGLMARGGFEVSMIWEDHKIKEIRVLSKRGGNLRLRSKTPLSHKGIKVAAGDNPNYLMNPIGVKDAVVSAEAKLKGIKPGELYEYDIDTKAGKTYVFRES